MEYLPARAASPLAVTAPTSTTSPDALAVRQAATTTSAASGTANITANVPLASIFTPNADCFDLPFGVLLDGTRSGAPSAFRDYSAARVSCYPSSYSRLELSTDLWFSPGVCPSGFTRASQLLGPTTSAWCCPSSMAYSYDGTNDFCSMYVATSTTVRSGTYTTEVPFSNFIALQWPISVQWASSDLARFTPASAPVLVQTQTSSTVSGRSTSSATASTTSSVSSVSAAAATSSAAGGGGLSTGAQAGIGAGIGALALALIGLGIWFLLRRRRNKMSQSPPSHDDATYGGMKAELPGSQDTRRYSDRKGLHGRHGEAIELESERDGLNELEGQNKQRMEPAELPGSAVGEHAAAEMAGMKSPVESDGKVTTGTEEQAAARARSEGPLAEHE
ncbi:hypothetical protein LTR86_001829 [Recurvomyces mirabilis]|nr:hypothetical protein LTR86_001829 [Recurvomyces mirabilis]